MPPAHQSDRTESICSKAHQVFFGVRKLCLRGFLRQRRCRTPKSAFSIRHRHRVDAIKGFAVGARMPPVHQSDRTESICSKAHQVFFGVRKLCLRGFLRQQAAALQSQPSQSGIVIALMR